MNGTTNPPIPLSFFRSETAERVREEGRVEGREEGRVQGHAADALHLLERRGIAVSGEVRERVLACRDAALAEAWFDRAIDAARAEDVFGDD